jgi:hypothetical protein
VPRGLGQGCGCPNGCTAAHGCLEVVYEAQDGGSGALFGGGVSWFPVRSPTSPKRRLPFLLLFLLVALPKGNEIPSPIQLLLFVPPRSSSKEKEE